MSASLRFIIVPKVAHPWFDEVHKGAKIRAAVLGRELGTEIIIDYQPPASCDVTAQNAILEKLVDLRPDGIAVDPVDTIAHMTAIRRIRSLGIPLVLFDSPSPDPGITGIGNDFSQQGSIAAERLAGLIGYAGKVAIMKGYSTAPNHKARCEAQVAVLKKYPEIHVVDGGTDNDDIETAHRAALTVLEAHQDLTGYLCCDASGPVGIARAIKQTGKTGRVKVVGMDGIRPILEAIKEGVIDASSATIPEMQGAMAVLMLWQASLGLRLPQTVDTGIDLITQDNVDQFLNRAD
jgi:ribose transport system substrate-binding protein